MRILVGLVIIIFIIYVIGQVIIAIIEGISSKFPKKVAPKTAHEREIELTVYEAKNEAEEHFRRAESLSEITYSSGKWGDPYELGGRYAPNWKKALQEYDKCLSLWPAHAGAIVGRIVAINRLRENQEKLFEKHDGTAGYIYILSNPSLPNDMFKVGYTLRSVEARVQELSASTSTPTNFEIKKIYTVNNPMRVEKIIHEALSKYRKPGKEFFEIDLHKLNEIILPIIRKHTATQIE